MTTPLPLVTAMTKSFLDKLEQNLESVL